jgi:hypothetical protein
MVPGIPCDCQLPESAPPPAPPALPTLGDAHPLTPAAPPPAKYLTPETGPVVPAQETAKEGETKDPTPPGPAN